MKKIFNLVIASFLVLSMGFVLAQGSLDGSGSADNQNGSGPQDVVNTGTGNQGDASELQNQVRSGNYETSDGRQMQIQEMSNNQMELTVGNSKAMTGLQISSETSGNKTTLRTQLSNGRNVEIKVMPDAASEKALERLRLKTCTEEKGCSIELKEVGKGDSAKLAYEVKTKRTSRILGMFKKNMNVEAQVNAENGEVIRTGKPWWAFLASEPAEE